MKLTKYSIIFYIVNNIKRYQLEGRFACMFDRNVYERKDGRWEARLYLVLLFTLQSKIKSE
jgi:hypothetical protein